MSVIITNRIWRDKKPSIGSSINWSHPLARGIVGGWLMNEGGGLYFKNLVTQKLSSLTNYPTFYLGEPLWGNCIKGVGRRCKINADVKDNAPDSSTNKMTFLFYCYIITGANASGGIVFASSNYTGGLAGIYTGWSQYKDIWFQINGTKAVSPTAPLQSNTVNMIVGTYDGVNIKLYNNGKLLQTTAYSTAPSTDTNPILFALALTSVVIYAARWNRALSPSEIQQLYVEPYCFIAPLRRRFYIQVGAPPVAEEVLAGYMTGNKYW